MPEAKCDARALMDIILEYRLGGVQSTDISIDILPFTDQIELHNHCQP